MRYLLLTALMILPAGTVLALPHCEPGLLVEVPDLDVQAVIAGDATSALPGGAAAPVPHCQLWLEDGTEARRPPSMLLAAVATDTPPAALPPTAFSEDAPAAAPQTPGS